MRRLLVVAVLIVLVAPRAARADTGGGPIAYHPPVDAPVVDAYRPPPAPFAAGNRGIDYGTAPGTDVRAAADGVVGYAGRIAGAWHVVVVHADGLRTSYSFMSSVTVRRNERVRAGHVVGQAGEQPLHFGVRAGDVYLDPATLLAGPARVYLVPESERGVAAEADERRGVMSLLGALGRRVADVNSAALGWARRAPAAVVALVDAGVDRQIEGLGRLHAQLVALRHYATNTIGHALAIRLAWRLAETIGEWHGQRDDCTPRRAPIPPLAERHLVVLVGGLASSGGDGDLHAAVDEVDAPSLGFRPSDVFRFSYTGGTVAESQYGAADTQADLRHSARRLRSLLEALHFRHPDVPIDVIAHSQGGLVARTYLAYEHDPLDPRLPDIPAVVTLGTPFGGADGATALAALRSAPITGPALEALRLVDPLGLDPASASIKQMAETSRFLRDLDRVPLPEGVQLTSIAARTDLIVASHHSRVRGARNVVVEAGAVSAHDALPGASAAQREVALAVRGMAPTCQSLADMLTDTAVGSMISAAEDSAAAAVLLLADRAGLRNG